jgi:hypothetical protein
LTFVLELGENAFMLFDVPPMAQIHRLIQGVALLKGVEIPAFDYITHRRHLEVGWNGDVAARNPTLAIEEPDLDAAFIIHIGHHSRTGGVELVLELVASAIGPARCIGGAEKLEHDAFLSLSL